MLAFAPQLDDGGPQPVSAPMSRPRKPQARFRVVVGRGQGIGRPEAARRLAKSCGELLARCDRRALVAGDGGQAAAPRTACEIVVAFACERVHHRPFDAQLTAEPVPQEDDRGPGLLLELPALARAVVRVEGEIPRVRDDLLAQDDAYRGPAAVPRRREAHGIRVALDLLVPGLAEPGCRERHGVGRQRVRQGLETRVHAGILAPWPVKRRFSLAGRHWLHASCGGAVMYKQILTAASLALCLAGSAAADDDRQRGKRVREVPATLAKASERRRDDDRERDRDDDRRDRRDHDRDDDRNDWRGHDRYPDDWRGRKSTRL